MEGGPEGDVASKAVIILIIILTKLQDVQFNDSLIAMEDILEMLKLLDYDNKFCRQKYITLLYIIYHRGFKPLSKTFFSIPSSNPSEQFIYFVSLVSWLLSINNHQVTGWNKYDDPMTAS